MWLLSLRFSHAEVPAADAPTPTLASKTSTTVRLSWAGIPGKNHLIWNLLMNRVSVYSGVEHGYEQAGLAPASCYTFQLAYYWRGQWSQFSSPFNVSTAATSEEVDPFAIDAELALLRQRIERRALAASAVGCDLAQLTNPQYVTGFVTGTEFIGTLGPLSRAGVQASRRNCVLSQCNQASASTQSVVTGKNGYLRLRRVDGVFEQVYAQIPPGSNYVAFSGASGPLQQHTASLLGCRAHNMTWQTAAKLALLPGRAKSDVEAAAALTRNCLEVNCTGTLQPMYLCEPATGPAARDLQDWRHVINRASHPQHTFQKYEVCVKIEPARTVESPRLQLYMQSAFREAWMSTFLMRLTLSQTSPHFPALFDFFSCRKLPDAFANSPQLEAAGALSPFVGGASGVAAALQMSVEEGGTDQQFASIVMESFSTHMQDLTASYKDFALSRAFVQGVAFQLLHALGVAKRVFGFHHNDLLTLSNIRFRQIPRESLRATPFWCYVLNDVAFTPLEEYHESDLTTVSEMTFGEMLQPNGCEAPTGNSTRSFCINADEVDGLRVLLYGFSSSALIKPELAMWKDGWAFQNTPWTDDAKDVGVIICDMLAPRVAVFSEPGNESGTLRDFCAALKNGTFASNVLLALQHQFFADLPALHSEVHAGDAQIFTFLPKAARVPTSAGETSNRGQTATTVSGDADSGVVGTGLQGVPVLSQAQNSSLQPTLAARQRVPWIKAQDGSSVTIAWSNPNGALVSVLLNDVTVFTGRTTTWEQHGLNRHDCYRFQVALFDGTIWRNPGVPLLVNDCSGWKAKMCRKDKFCRQGLLLSSNE